MPTINANTAAAAQGATEVHHHHHGGGMRQQGMQDLAKALGMNQADLTQALGSGKSVADIAKQQGVSLDSLKNTLTQDMQQRLTQGLQSGKISQQQFDTLSQRTQSFIGRMLQEPAQGPAQTPLSNPSGGVTA